MEIVAEVLRFGDGFVPAFILTWLIESIVYLAAFVSLDLLAVRPALRQAHGTNGQAQGTNRPAQGANWSVGGALLLTLVLNLATHPLLWLYVSRTPGLGPLVLAEISAVVVEGAILGLVLRRRLAGANPWLWAYLIALLANAVSLLVGLTAFPLVLRVVGAAGSSACC